MPQPQILITVTPQGEVQFQSTVQDQIVIYGMLEMAKDALREGLAKAKTNSIVAAPAAALKQLQATG